MKESEQWVEELSKEVIDFISNGGLDQSTEVKVLKVMLARASDQCQECKSPHSGNPHKPHGSNGSNGSNGFDKSEALGPVLRVSQLPSHLR